ncbi:uncharacterized protein BN601_01498 [Coraliomargarita sp. CAG:312]|nr:uncharacterized protein BN601_01498 [Coraliomargarita sp. CAG:312]
MDITFIPPICGGIIFSSGETSGKTLSLKRIAALGPCISQSIRPTRASPGLENIFANARARFTATVLLPTPPLPEATAIFNFTPDKVSFLGFGAGIFLAGSSERRTTLKTHSGNADFRTPFACSTIFLASSWSPPVNIRTSAEFPSTLTYFTMPKATMLF